MKKIHYAWIIVICAAGLVAAQHLIAYTRGIFVIPMTTEFGWDRGVFAGAFSMSSLISAPLGIFTGRLCDKYGPRILLTINGVLVGVGLLLASQVNALWQLYLIWAFFVGIGASCGYVPVISTVPKWFVKRRGLALGIVSVGVSLGGIVWPLMAQGLVSAYDWRIALIGLGSVLLIITVGLAQFMKHSPKRAGLSPYGAEEVPEGKQSPGSKTVGLSLSQAVKTGRFWVFALILFCFWGCSQVVFVHIIPSAIDVGISAMTAAGILSIFSFVTIGAKLSVGYISDKIGSRVAFTTVLGIMTLAFAWVMFAKELWMYYLFAVIFGIAYGGFTPLQGVLTAELFGLSHLGALTGATILFDAIGIALLAPYAGLIFDITGNYFIAFLTCAVLGVLTVVLSIILRRYPGIGVTK